MKTLIVILIIASFIQTTILPIDLVLLILICRAYIRSGRENLYLAFGFGLFTAHLNLISLGLSSLIYLVVMEITQMLSRLRLAGNPLLILPISIVVLSISEITGSYFTGQTIEFPKVIIPAILSLPVFYLMKLWEERFIVRKEIKLKF